MSHNDAPEPVSGSARAVTGERAPEPVATAGQRHDAIIFIPGFVSAEHRNMAHITEVLCQEFDRAAACEAARFVVRSSSVPVGDDVAAVRTIWRIDGENSSPVVDIYGTDYGALQGGPDTTPTNPLARTLALALTVLAGILIWAAAWGRRNKRAKSLKQMLQLLACLVILLLLGAYLVLAIVAVVQLSLTAAGVNASSITWPQALVVVVAVLGILLPGVRERLSQAAEDYLQMMRYLWVAGPRNSLRGEVLTLLERASERTDVDRIHIAGFSFGSLVAIDVVFPASKPPTSRMARVVSLATIGCPFDLVRMLQPAYFQNRFAAVDSPPVWINIYDPIDVLGSNFRDEGDPGEAATKGVEIRSAQDLRKPTANLPWNPEPLTVINALMLASLRAHAQYWGPNPHADSALGYLVTGLFSGTAALR